MPAGRGGAGTATRSWPARSRASTSRPPGQRRGARQHHPQRVRSTGAPKRRSVRRRPGGAPAPRRAAPLGEHPQLLGGGQLLQVDVEAGGLGRRAAPAARAASRRASPAAPRPAGCPARRRGSAPIRLRSRSSRGEQLLAPRSSSSCPAAVRRTWRREPVEQLDAQLALQPLDRLAQRRLGHAEQLRGPAEVQLLGDDQEVPQVPEQIHGPTIRRDHGGAGYRAAWTWQADRGSSTPSGVGQLRRGVHAVTGCTWRRLDGGREVGVRRRRAGRASPRSSRSCWCWSSPGRSRPVSSTRPSGCWCAPADRLGGWGPAGCADDAEMSLRDLAYFAMSVSDNTAADLLLRRVGPDLLPHARRRAGADPYPRRSAVRGSCSRSMLADVGARTEAEFARIFPTLPAERVRALRVLRPRAHHLQHRPGDHPAAHADLAGRGRAGGGLRDGARADGPADLLDPAGRRFPAGRPGGRQDRHPARVCTWRPGSPNTPTAAGTRSPSSPATEQLTPRRIDVDLAHGGGRPDGRRGAARRLISRPPSVAAPPLSRTDIRWRIEADGP